MLSYVSMQVISNKTCDIAHIEAKEALDKLTKDLECDYFITADKARQLFKDALFVSKDMFKTK
jgi:hypothetical protein